MKYEFIAEYAHEHSVMLMCKVLKASRSGYYSFISGVKSARETANERLLEEIRTAHQESHKRYGSPRIFHALKLKGIKCGRHRIARLMAKSGIRGRVRRRFRITTRRDMKARYAPDQLERKFVATRPHEVWMSDITFIWTEEGWLYLAVVLDLFTRMVVGWSTGPRIDAELVCRAINNALVRYNPTMKVIFHSDRGSQYTSEVIRLLLIKNPEVPLVASHGSSCYDNAVMESFFHTLKIECEELEHPLSRQAAHNAIFDYIEIFYNRTRFHSSLNNLTPLEKIQSYSIQKTENLNLLSEEMGE